MVAHFVKIIICLIWMGRTGHGPQYYEFEWVWSGSGLGVHGLRLGWAWGLGTHETLCFRNLTKGNNPPAVRVRREPPAVRGLTSWAITVACSVQIKQQRMQWCRKIWIVFNGYEVYILLNADAVYELFYICVLFWKMNGNFYFHRFLTAPQKIARLEVSENLVFRRIFLPYKVKRINRLALGIEDSFWLTNENICASFFVRKRWK